MASTFKLNSGWFKEALHGEIADAACLPKATEIAGRAMASAPVDSGAYESSIHVEVVSHPTRNAYQVTADVDYAMIVEANHGTLASSL